MAQRVREQRVKPRIPAACVIKAALLMLGARLGSLNALDQGRARGWWRKWLGGDLPSADTSGRVAAGLNLQDLRAALREHYARRKRMKTLKPVWAGKFFLILDGHESTSSYLRSCEQCLQRTVQTKQGPRTQFYHRYVAALLLHAEGVLPVDLEPQLPGEDEMAPAQRLLARLLEQMPRAFDVVLGDALYLHPGFCQRCLRHGKDFLIVLKNENRELIQDARALFASQIPVEFKRGKTAVCCWDIEGFTSWSSLHAPVRALRTTETTQIKRQAAPKEAPPETRNSEWLWVTSLSKQAWPSEQCVAAAHTRWRIENDLFNVICNQWHADHVYKHHPNAINAFMLLLFLTFNLVQVFLARNLKPQLRKHHRPSFWLETLHSAFFADFRHTPP